jgi:predicted protein tyrosine phosphatase
MNLLFICEKNVMRSRTAESVYSENNIHRAKSAGIAKSSGVRINSGLLHWADIIFVMEAEQKEFLINYFPSDIGHREIVILDIHDYYYFMEPELIELIKSKVDPYLENE